MRKILIINAVLSVFLIAGDSTFKLLDGTIINGVIETENVDNFLVKTKYGDITIDNNGTSKLISCFSQDSVVLPSLSVVVFFTGIR